MIAKSINVQVVYALPDKQYVIDLALPAGSTAQQAVEQSGITRQFPEINQATITLGIFGKNISGKDVIEEGMRVEIYRSLMIDPKQARRERAQRARSKPKNHLSSR